MAKSYMLLFFCVICWGSNFVFSSILVQEFSPLLLSAFRLTSTCLFMIGYGLVTKKLGRPALRDYLIIIPLGFVGTLLNQSTFFTGLQTVDATTSALILSLTPITVALLAMAFLKETFTKRMAVGSIIAFIGVFFVIGKTSEFKLSAGILYTVAAMLTFSISVILMRVLTQRLNPLTATVYATTIGTGMLIPVAFAGTPVYQISPHPWAWALLVGTSLVTQGICMLIWNGQLIKIGAGKASIFLNLQPFVAMIVGFLLLGTPVTFIQIIGALLIVGGVLLGTVPIKEKRIMSPSTNRTV